MSSQEITEYLNSLDGQKRATLQELRETILQIIPDADEGLSYGLPAFRLQGKVVAGFAAFKNHLSYMPHSGSVFPELKDDVASYSASKGVLRFSIDECLPKQLVQKLIDVRMSQALRT